MRAGDCEILALVVYLTKSGWICIAGLIVEDGIISPRPFPKLVDDMKIFIGDAIALIMLDLSVEAEIAAAESR